MPIAFLLALQASGMVVDWLGKNEQVRLGKLGAEVEKAGIESNIQMSRLEAEEASLQSMKQLRQNLGTQMAVLAARGTRGDSSSAVFGTAESVGNFNADERIRKINQLGREASLRAGKTLSDLHQQTSVNNTWNEFRKNAISKVPTSKAAWSEIRSSFGLTKVGA